MDAKLAQAIRVKAQGLYCKVEELLDEYDKAVEETGLPKCSMHETCHFDPGNQLEEAMRMLEAVSRNLEADATPAVKGD